MLKGTIDRRVSPRVPFQTELRIRLERNGELLGVAATTDISPGGFQFSVPADSVLTAMVGENAELAFNLPELGETAIKGEIRYKRSETDTNQNRLIFYGVRFIDLNMETWNTIMKYYRTRASESEQGAASGPVAAVPAAPAARGPVAPAGSSCVANLEIAGGRAILGWVEGLGFGGLQVRINESLELNTAVKVRLYHEKSFVRFDGICVWCNAPNGRVHEYMAGIRLGTLGKEQFEGLKALMAELHQARAANRT